MRPCNKLPTVQCRIGSRCTADYDLNYRSITYQLPIAYPDSRGRLSLQSREDILSKSWPSPLSFSMLLNIGHRRTFVRCQKARFTEAFSCERRGTATGFPNASEVELLGFTCLRWMSSRWNSNCECVTCSPTDTNIAFLSTVKTREG